MERAEVVQLVFSVICAGLISAYALHNMLETAHSAEKMLQTGARVQAQVHEIRRDAGRHCRKVVSYTFRADDGSIVSNKERLSCLWRERWPVSLFFADEKPSQEALEVVFEKGAPTNSRLLWALQREVEFRPFMLAVILLFLWFAFYRLAARLIAWLVLLP